MKYIKIIIIIISIINSSKIFSQNNCNGAIQLDSLNIERNYYINNSEYWLQFKADSVNFSLIVNPYIDINAAEISIINFYQGDCNSLTQLKTINVQEGDSTFALSLTIGENYYIQVINNSGIGGYFSLNCSNINKSWGVNLYCGPQGCNAYGTIINPNPEFDIISNDLNNLLNLPNPSGYLYDNPMIDAPKYNYYTDVCNWIAYRNTPQLKKEANGNKFLYMWAYKWITSSDQESVYNRLIGNNVPGGIGLISGGNYILSYDYNFNDVGWTGPSRLVFSLFKHDSPATIQSIVTINYNSQIGWQSGYTAFTCNSNDYDALLITPYQEDVTTYGVIRPVWIDNVKLTTYIPLKIDLEWGKPCEMQANFTFSMPNTPNITYTWHLPNNAVITNYYAPNNIWVNWNNAGLATITLEGRDPNGCLVYYGSYTLNYDDNCVANATSYNSLTSSQIIALNNGVNTLSTTNQIKFTGITIIDEDLEILNCPNIFMGANAKIVVMPGKKLQISGSTLQGCTCPWDGIFTENSTATVLISNSTIRDARNAVVSSNRGYFNITTTNFVNNKIGLWVRRYNPEWIPDGSGGYIAPPENNGYIASSTFTKNTGISGFYSGVYDGLTAIVVDTVYKLTIGDFNTVSYTNYFSNLQYVVKIKKSDVSIFNNSFSNIELNSTLPHPIYQTVGSYVEPYEAAIYSIMDNEVNPPYMPLKSILNVGGLNNKSNSFENCNVGVYGRNCKAVIEYNNFTNQNYVSVHLKDFIVNSKVQYNNISMTNTLFAANNLYNSTILAEQTIATANVILDINNNTINNTRTGVNIRNCNGNNSNNYCVIDANTVNFSSVNLNNLYYGIKALNCDYSKIQNNNIVSANAPASSLQGILQGIYLDLTENASVGQNRMNYMGDGMCVNNVTLNTQFFCNDFDQC